MSMEIITEGRHSSFRLQAGSVTFVQKLVSFIAVATGDMYQRRFQGNSYGDHIVLCCTPIHSAQRPIEINLEKLYSRTRGRIDITSKKLGQN